MSDTLLPCPFCGGDARNDAHSDDCYFILHKAMVNAPNADLSMVPDVLKAWNRRAALAQAQSLPDVDALTDKIASMLGGTYHCMRVWSAWHVGTMSQDDFDPVDESETPREIAEEIHAMLAAPPQPKD